jgi:hypothetical protein
MTKNHIVYVLYNAKYNWYLGERTFQGLHFYNEINKAKLFGTKEKALFCFETELDKVPDWQIIGLTATTD